MAVNLESKGFIHIVPTRPSCTPSIYAFLMSHTGKGQLPYEASAFQVYFQQALSSAPCASVSHGLTGYRSHLYMCSSRLELPTGLTRHDLQCRMDAAAAVQLSSPLFSQSTAETHSL